jgi:ubiquinone/menaquinone biosynthesis C-methylase UbiE
VTQLRILGLEPSGRCLDFGCGVGRLAQALCLHFDSSEGIDIAPSMIELANIYSHYGDRCRYHLNDAPDLRIFADRICDFTLCLLVLQHMEPQSSKRYINELIRVLKPGSVAFFQAPSSYLSFKLRPILADSGCRARISLSCHWLSTYPCQRLVSNVSMRNESGIAWPKYPADGNEFARLNVANH